MSTRSPKRPRPAASSSIEQHPLLTQLSLSTMVVPTAVRKLCEELVKESSSSTAANMFNLSQEALDLSWERLHTGDDHPC